MSERTPDLFEIIVVGAGHAGCEAALAAARMGLVCLLVTINTDHVAALSCNPAVGGLAKGHLVKEIDALGGEMALNTDATGIQFRVLNQAKGPAVWSSRAQVDIQAYPARMRKTCMQQPGLWMLEAEVAGLILEKGRARGIITAGGQKIPCQRVILTAGTFLRGVIHLGLKQTPAGRMGDPPSNALSEQLAALGLRLSRLKTGTTPRLAQGSLDLDSLPQQWGDESPRMFSFLSQAPKMGQTCCWLTHTTGATHDIIRDNLHLAPMYAGVITGVGARYCPSVEDKVVRFPEKPSHQVFLEPQGLDNGLVYPNGIPTSLPWEVQKRMVQTMPGCERAFIVRPGYAIEYDFADPMDLTPDLQSKIVPGLYLAGQVNGTSGYEEAAGQGLMAGINAVRDIRDQEPLLLDRSQAYLGVLIDDLVTRGTSEPYRMFTSRAEYRLTLREDNADMRLTGLGREIGLVDDRRWRVFREKSQALERNWDLLNQVRINPSAPVNDKLARMGSAPLRSPMPAAKLLRRPDLGIVDLAELDPALETLTGLPQGLCDQLEIQAHYCGYQEREREQVARFKEREAMRLPADLDYTELPGLSREVQEKLMRVRPINLGQAGRISGITPAALSVLSLYLHKLARQGQKEPGGPGRDMIDA
ncbi:MAG: tRNA uridine-5-carboxymethylaminomethyl(34) synthesis enzyme MnmG [Desulfarculaceae bacterium]